MKKIIMKNYIVNKKERQIHCTSDTTELCNVDESLLHYRRRGWFRAWWLITFCGYDGCGHCMPKKSKINAK